MVDVLCTKTQKTDRGFFRAEVAYFLGKVASSMRAAIVTRDRGEIPVNIYALALATSGYGKGHSITVIEDEFLGSFKKRFFDDTFPVISEQHLWEVANARSIKNSSDQQEEFDKAKGEWLSAGPLPFTFDSATTAAVKQLREKLLMSNIGALSLQVDEIGLNLMGSVDILTPFLELYDKGRIKPKLVKNTNENKRIEEVDGHTPTNMLLFGTPSKLFDGGQTEDMFYSMLDTGYARRCIFGYGLANTKNQSKSAEEVYALLTDKSNENTIIHWSSRFNLLADPAMYNWKMTTDDDVSIALLAYKIDCEDRAHELAEHEEIKKAEISHRYFKALKLAGAYAFVDASTEITMDHLNSAIKLVEESGEAFFSILSRDKAYVKLAKFIAGCGYEVTHADLTESLPFYPKSNGPRNDMLLLATSWGYKNHIIIKKNFTDGIEFFKGEALEETNLDQCIISYSQHWAYNFAPEKVPFDQLYLLTQAQDYHWINHHVKNQHRAEENIIEGFNLVVIDVDFGTPIALARELLKDYKFLIYTTKSHQKEDLGDRYRIILPTNYILHLDSDDYKEMMNAVMAWLPFPEKTDESANQRSKKWECRAGDEMDPSQGTDQGGYFYNEGALLDILPFIPKTSRNEAFQAQNKNLQSLDNLERWFAQRMVSGVNRNNQMIKYALLLVDGGWDFNTVREHVLAFDSKLPDPLGEDELDRSIFITVAKRYQSA